jgi:hypothetical protein
MTITSTRSGTDTESPDPTELLIKEARQLGRRRRIGNVAVVFAAFVAVATVVSTIAYYSHTKTSTATANKKVVVADYPRCSASSDLSVKFIGQNGASSMAYFLITFINNGAKSCALSGAPSAQAVAGPNGAPIGPPAKYLQTSDVEKSTVELHSHGGKAWVWYYVIEDVVWTTQQCGPRSARGVELNPDGIKSFYIPIGRFGSELVCTKRPSTGIGPLASKTY